MIHLRDQDLIATSKTRKCYLHPEDPDKVIKILQKRSPFFKRDANWKEWRHYQYLTKRHPRLDFITKYHGFVTTNLGRGLMSDCIRDVDGKISVRLEKVLANPSAYDLAALEQSLRQITKTIVENNIQLFDLNQFNILIQVLAGGAYRPVSIDIKGRFNNYEFIPVSTYIPYFSRLKLNRRRRRLLKMIERAGQSKLAAKSA